MERVQAVTVKLSNGKTGVFYGAALAEKADAEATVVEVSFDEPRHVAGIRFTDIFSPPMPGQKKREDGTDEP